MKKLAIITTHPIQYYAPVFKLLHQNKRIEVRVFYTWGKAALEKYDPGFGKRISWDVPLLEDYQYEWVKNTSNDPGSHHFSGIINPDLNKQISTWQPDAILFFGWAYQSHLKALRYFKNKIPVYFRGDSTLLDEQTGMKSILKSILLKWVYHHVDHAFYVGTNNQGYFKKFGLKEGQLSFAPHAVDNDRFAVQRTTDALQLRQTLGIDDTQIIILFAGKLEEKKSPMFLLNGFLLLHRADIHLLFVGNGELEDQLKQKAAGNGNIHFLPFQNQSYMPVVYQACDLFCLPSKGPGETWGLAVNEAMACRKAVLVSDKVGCAIDLVKNNGRVFKSENIDDLTLCLKELTSSKELLIAYGEQSKEVIKNWNFEKVVTAIEDELINEKN